MTIDPIGVKYLLHEKNDLKHDPIGMSAMVGVEQAMNWRIFYANQKTIFRNYLDIFPKLHEEKVHS